MAAYRWVSERSLGQKFELACIARADEARLLRRSRSCGESFIKSSAQVAAVYCRDTSRCLPNGPVFVSCIFIENEIVSVVAFALLVGAPATGENGLRINPLPNYCQKLSSRRGLPRRPSRLEQRILDGGTPLAGAFSSRGNRRAAQPLAA
jgi:hypothetical protein